ncbi:hypothetical protein [Natrialba sp. SSL1]|uniref:hypothetical protein n=1 Tax=Natrialba sp. SSL1 TaxID=1869245 RepID=UPI000A04A832|nr:hypothetical protein [Natrialba sp. SSL1]
MQYLLLRTNHPSERSDCQRGIPVDAICVGCGCGRTRVKRAPLAEVSKDPSKVPAELEAEDLTSLKHVCHRCGSATWWNAVAVLSGLLEQRREIAETLSTRAVSFEVDTEIVVDTE